MEETRQSANNEQTAQARTNASEIKLLDLGVLSCDGLDGMDYDRAVKVATYSVPRSLKHYRAALKRGAV